MSNFFKKYGKAIFITILLSALFYITPFLLFQNLDRIALMIMPKLDVNKQTMQQISEALSALHHAQSRPPITISVCGAALITCMFTKCSKQKRLLFAAIPIGILFVLISMAGLIFFTEVNCVRFDKVITALLPLL